MSATRPGVASQVQALLASLPAQFDALSPPASLPTSSREVAAFVDHTLLAPQSTTAEIKKLCVDAVALGTASVCVNSSVVGVARKALGEAKVMAICTVGFPFGAACSRGKAAETEQAVRDGAQEIDMVQNVGWVREARWDDVFDDVEAVVKAAGAVPVKVILETCYLTREEIAASTLVCCLAGAAFVKTSTGYGTGGAKAEDIRLMAEVAHARGVKVKASGGIRSWQTAALMIENGADRVGASGTRAIIEQFEAGGSASSEATAGGY